MIIKKFNEIINEEMTSKASLLDGDIKLYRLTSHNILDLSSPGEYYLNSKSKLDPKILKKSGGDLYVVTVKCNSSNIDLDKSEKECAKLDNNGIVAVKNDNKCELVSVEPFTTKK